MKALILRGRQEGKEVEISQWCNDWFSDEDGGVHSPSHLAFTDAGFNEITQHGNNGMLFILFTQYLFKEPYSSPNGDTIYTIGFRSVHLPKLS